jgi:tetratricopeptide (TPR) repeat protein
MSPEQCSGAKKVPLDSRTDIYSLGASLYEVLTFQPAFAAEDRSELFHQIMDREPTPPRKLIPSVPADLDTICLKALEKAPPARYQTAKEMADDLHLYLRDLPIVARRVGPVGRAIRFIKRHRAATLAAVAVCLLMLAVSVAVVYQRNARQERLFALITEGGTFMKLAQWENAETAFYRVLDEESHNFRGLVNLAIAKKELYYKKKDDRYLEESNKLLDRVLEIEPRRNEIWNMKGIVLRTQGALDEAIAALKRSLELNDKYYSTWVNLGSVYTLQGNLEQAERHLKSGAELMAVSNDSLPWHNLAAVQLQLDRPEALESIQNALRADKVADRKGVPSQLLRAKLHLQLSGHVDPSLALRYASVAETNSVDDSGNPRLKRTAALAYLRTEQWTPAVEAAKLALEYGDAPSYPNLILAIASAELGNRELASQHLENARSAWPEDLPEYGYQASIRGGLLWLDSEAELQGLLQEAERLVTN